MTESNVTALHGAPVVTPEVQEGVVSLLEDYLARAKAGDITGATICAYHMDETTSYGFYGFYGVYGRGLVGAIEVMKSEMVETLRD